MAYILTLSCSKHPYGLKDEEMEEEPDPEIVPLMQWSPDHWKKLQLYIKDLRRLMLRKDADLNYLDPEDVIEDASVIANERAKSEILNRKYKLLMNQVTIHSVLSPVRHAIESQIDGQKEKKRLSRKELDAVWLTITTLPDGVAKDALRSLFQEGPREEGKPPNLNTIPVLKQALHGQPFDLVGFQNMMEQYMHQLNQMISGNHDCVLMEARYTIPKDSELYQTLAPPPAARVAQLSARRRQHTISLESRQLDELRRGRADLNKNHGEDPLQATVAVAAGAKGKENKEEEPADNDEEEEKAAQKTKGKRKVLKKLEIVDQLEDDEEDDIQEASAYLSQIPKRQKHSTTVTKDPSDVPPDDGIFDANMKVLKRLKWTEEEKTAVKQGVKECGVGKWREIKYQYGKILRNRTPVQIKDCWRTMTKNNEV